MQDPNDYPDQVYLIQLYRRISGMPSLLVQEEIPPSCDPQGIRYIQYREYERLQKRIRQLEKEIAECYADDRRKNED